jgi:hypothetical protein
MEIKLMAIRIIDQLGKGGGKKVDMVIKGQHEDPCGDENVLYQCQHADFDFT